MTADNSATPAFQLKPGFHTPSRTGTIGMYLFLAALFMLFAAGLLGYVMVRTAAEQKLPFGSLHIPNTLWLSTGLVIGASVTIHLALQQVRREHQRPFRAWVAITLLLAICFVIVQTPSMLALWANQKALFQQKLALYGLVFFLILIHALHVLGGIIALARTWQQARRGVYDHEHYQPVRHVALYWHFLDGVWLAMFFTFLAMK